jgi:hypothetical protein
MLPACVQCEPRYCAHCYRCCASARSSQSAHARRAGARSSWLLAHDDEGSATLAARPLSTLARRRLRDAAGSPHSILSHVLRSPAFMNRFVHWICLLAVLGPQVGCEIGVEQPNQPTAQQPRTEAPRPRRTYGGLQFVEGFAAGREAAVKQRKPMLLFFTASWCQYCHQMADEAFAHPQVISLSQQFVCVLVDADAEAEVCRQFQVTGYPTIQFLSPRGVPLNRVVGKQPGQQVTMAMQTALQQVARRLNDDGRVWR